MDNPRFVYVTYIKTSPEKLWEALTKPEFTRQYWSGCWQDSEWIVRSPWRLMTPDGRVGDSGEIVAIDPPKRLTVTWRHQLHPDLHTIGDTQMTFALEPIGEAVKLTVTHEAPEGGEAFVAAISQGWPSILSSVKSLVETGEALPGTDKWPEGV